MLYRGTFGKQQAKFYLIGKKDFGEFKPSFFAIFRCYEQFVGKLWSESPNSPIFSLAKLTLYIHLSSESMHLIIIPVPTELKSQLIFLCTFYCY